MRQQEDFEVPQPDSGSGYPWAAPADSGVGIPRQRTGNAQPDTPSPYPVLLREGQPRFQPAATAVSGHRPAVGARGRPDGRA